MESSDIAPAIFPGLRGKERQVPDGPRQNVPPSPPFSSRDKSARCQSSSMGSSGFHAAVKHAQLLSVSSALMVAQVALR
jgi:hypothetical protein